MQVHLKAKAEKKQELVFAMIFVFLWIVAVVGGWLLASVSLTLMPAWIWWLVIVPAPLWVALGWGVWKGAILLAPPVRKYGQENWPKLQPKAVKAVVFPLAVFVGMGEIIWAVVKFLWRPLSKVLGFGQVPKTGKRTWSIWIPYWMLIAGSVFYFLVIERPMGLIPAIVIVAVGLVVFLALRVLFPFGSGYLPEEVEYATRRSVFGILELGFRDVPWFLMWIPAMFPLWVSLIALEWYLEGDWNVFLFNENVLIVIGLCVIYWLIWLAIRWRRHGIIVTKNGDIVDIQPAENWLDVLTVREATVQIKSIAKSTQSPFAILGFSRRWNPGLALGEDKVDSLYVPFSLIRVVMDKRKKLKE